MKNNQKNWCLSLGLIIIGIVFGVNHFIKLPDIIEGLGIGISLGLELIGLYSTNHDITKIKIFKKNLIGKFVK